MQAQKVIAELDEYLTSNGFYASATSEEKIENINISINANWQTKIEEALRIDLRAMLHNDDLQVKQTKSIFDIISDEQGATVFKSFLDLTDQNETMGVVVRLNIYHRIAFIYLGTSHTHEEKYTGTSETLRQLFIKLKAREQVGNFSHSKFYELSYNDTSIQHNNTPTTSRFVKWLQKIFTS